MGTVPGGFETSSCHYAAPGNKLQGLPRALPARITTLYKPRAKDGGTLDRDFFRNALKMLRLQDAIFCPEGAAPQSQSRATRFC